MAWAIHKKAAHEIGNRNFAFTVPGSTGSQVPSPWIKILNQQATSWSRLGDRLGLDPKSRAALKLPAARQQRSEFDGLIGIRGFIAAVQLMQTRTSRPRCSST